MDPSAAGPAAKVATAPADRRAPRRAYSLAGVAALAVVAAYGFVLRAWLVAHSPLDSDQAVVGLMAKAALAGHFSTFYWGQAYGGAETYLAAPIVWATRGSPFALDATAALLSAVAAVVVGATVAEATGRRFAGAAAGTLAWVWPYAVVWNSLRETGFRGVNVVCGLVMVYVAVRIGLGGNRWRNGVALGLAAGVGWWSSPEIAYFALPTAVVLAASWERLFAGRRRWAAPWRPGPVLAALGAAAVGALPWIYTNAGSSFASLRTSSLPAYMGIGYGGRLSVFFRAMLPVQLGVRSVPGGQWAVGPVAGPVLYGVLLVVVAASVARAVVAARRGRRAAPALAAAAGVVAFPFLYAAVPSSGYWLDGRYGVALPALVVLLLATAWVGVPAEEGEAVRSTRAAHAAARRGFEAARVAVLCAAVVAGAGLTVVTASAAGVPVRPQTFFTGWSDPEQPMRAAGAVLVDAGVHDAYASYWVAYVLDDLFPGRLAVSPSYLDVVRWPAEAAAVRRAPDPAWLFVAPAEALEADRAVGNPEPGPGNYTEHDFESLLAAQGVGYRVLHLGVLDAVVPDHRVTLPRP
ncbi:MAG: hypothetical protein ACLP62_00400 [Acidimicrobiales bacterium]